LKHAREDYIHEKIKLVHQGAVIGSQKIPRMISTCPSALKQLLAKSKLAGISQEPIVNQQASSSSKSVSFTADFVKYYFGEFIYSLFRQFQ
jgi:hypothetical protein